MSTKNPFTLFPCAPSIIPAFHLSIIPFPKRLVTGWSRVENLRKPLILLRCHDVTTWSTLVGGAGGDGQMIKSPISSPLSTFFHLLPPFSTSPLMNAGRHPNRTALNRTYWRLEFLHPAAVSLEDASPLLLERGEGQG